MCPHILFVSLTSFYEWFSQCCRTLFQRVLLSEKWHSLNEWGTRQRQKWIKRGQVERNPRTWETYRRDHFEMAWDFILTLYPNIVKLLGKNTELLKRRRHKRGREAQNLAQLDCLFVVTSSSTIGRVPFFLFKRGWYNLHANHRLSVISTSISSVFVTKLEWK